MSRYWIDTDPGMDDALAILLAVREVGADLVGFSTVQGNVDEGQTARNLSRVLSRYADAGLTPAGWSPRLTRGARLPLAGDRVRRAHSVHGADGLGNLPWLARAPWDTYGPRFGPQAIVDAARADRDLRLVCLGPLTNPALALRIEPDLPAMLGGLTIMGGSLRAGGNETMAAEFNFAADPEAARSVLEAGFRNVLLVPMDACLTVPVTGPDLDHLLALDTPAARVTGEILREPGWEHRIRSGSGAPLYDPGAWLATTHQELVFWQDVYVSVDTGRDLAHGASLADWRGRGGKAPNLRAALSIDRDAIFAAFFQALGA